MIIACLFINYVHINTCLMVCSLCLDSITPFRADGAAPVALFVRPAQVSPTAALHKADAEEEEDEPKNRLELTTLEAAASHRGPERFERKVTPELLPPDADPIAGSLSQVTRYDTVND